MLGSGMSPANDRPWDCQRLRKTNRLARMKRLAGIAAILLVAAAHSQTSSPPSAGSASGPPPDAADVNTATVYIREAWNDFTHCRRPSACSEYFDTFGVAIPFTDGSIVPFAHIQRLGATSRDCIKTAHTALEQGNRSLAVQWVMAARIENKRMRDWLGSHPDAVVEALRRCCS
jgi:hypothetical protein